MGVNSKEVCIGNEATFNKLPVEKTGVLGMDYLRMALEQASTAFEAMNIIIENTQHLVKAVMVDTSIHFFTTIAISGRSKEAYVLETVGNIMPSKSLKVAIT